MASQEPAFAFSKSTDSYQKITKHRSIFRYKKKGGKSDPRSTILGTGGGTASDRMWICVLHVTRRTNDDQNPFLGVVLVLSLDTRYMGLLGKAIKEIAVSI